MGYEIALKKAWDAVLKSGAKNRYIKFFNDEYEIDYNQVNIISLSCNSPAKDYYKLLILHYIANENKISKITSNNLISFKEFEGGEVYFSAFKKRAIDPIIRKYGDNPAAIFEKAGYLNAEKLEMDAYAISIGVFEKIKIAVIMRSKDDEFPADCNMLFNPEAKFILSTEDIAVLGGITASLL